MFAQQNYLEDQNDVANRENVMAGIVGAFLFSLVGGIAWYLFDLVGVIASFSGLIGVVLAIKGYTLFAKKESVKGIILSSVIAFLVLVLAWYLCFGKDIYDAYQMWYQEGEVDFTLTFSESVRAVPYFLTDPETGPAYVKDLAIGLIFALIGSVGTIMNAVKKLKNSSKISGAPHEGSAVEAVRENEQENPYSYTTPGE